MDSDQQPPNKPDENQPTSQSISLSDSNPGQSALINAAPAPTSDSPQDSEPEITPFRPAQKPNDKKKIWIIAGAVLLVLFIVIILWLIFGHKKSAPANSSTTNLQSVKTPAASTSQGLKLDPNKNYGNKYQDGILPVGDGKHESSGPKQGYVYACTDYARNLAAQAGGAGRPGPWFTDNDKKYNANKKLHVQGSVMWTADFSNRVSGSTRTIVTNDLPSHPTGVFPILASDPAYAYDKNPNSIKGQKFTYKLATDPTYNAKPNCEGGEVGIMLTGVALFSALDAGGRDAGAWEVQDSCDGHPQSDGIYHYHTLSSCIKNISVSTVIGYALDGFPITGPQVGINNILNTSDLDECHGIVSQINLDGKKVTMYHYVMTQDYPYSVSCYRGTPIQPPGQQEQQQNQSPQGQVNMQTGRQVPSHMPPRP